MLDVQAGSRRVGHSVARPQDLRAFQESTCNVACVDVELLQGENALFTGGCIARASEPSLQEDPETCQVPPLCSARLIPCVELINNLRGADACQARHGRHIAPRTSA